MADAAWSALGPLRAPRLRQPHRLPAIARWQGRSPSVCGYLDAADDPHSASD